jgi:dolichol-phosphate mannosyltransferase
MSVVELRRKNMSVCASAEVTRVSRSRRIRRYHPTLNERDNVALMVEHLDSALRGLVWEVIFVDEDSSDRTADRFRGPARSQGNIRCFRRRGPGRLCAACIEGILASNAPYLTVIDGDLQHGETLPRMLKRIKAEHFDIVGASRRVTEGGVGNWGKSRVCISDFATKLSRVVVSAELTRMTRRIVVLAPA